MLRPLPKNPRSVPRVVNEHLQISEFEENGNQLEIHEKVSVAVAGRQPKPAPCDAKRGRSVRHKSKGCFNARLMLLGHDR